MIKLLAIDDINDNLITLKAIINDAFPDAIVQTALNGEKGIELAIGNNPDVILLDVIMPDMDGFEVCRRLKQDERVSEIPVVFVTALKGDKENRIKALEVGAEGFLSKPIDETELIAQVRAMVKIKAANEQKINEKIRLKQLVAERTHKLELSQVATLNLLNELKAENEARKKTEESLRISEELFRNIFTISPDAIAISEVETGIYVEINAAFEKLSGFKREEIIGNSSVELGFWADSKEREKYIEQIKRTGSVDNLEISFVVKGGNIIHTIVSSRIIAHSGRLYMLNSIKDVTERILTEKAIKASEEKFRNIFDNVQDVYYEAAIDGTILEVSPSVMLLTRGQICREELLGKSIVDYYFKPEERNTLLKKLKEDGRVTDFEISFQNKDNSVIYTAVSCKIDVDKASNAEMIIGSMHDITERKHADEALHKSEEAYSRVISNIDEIIYSVAFCEPDWYGKMDFVSSQVKTILGYEPEEFYTNKDLWFSIIHPDDAEILKLQTLSNLEKKITLPRVYRVLHKYTGEYIWLEDHPRYSFDNDDNIIAQYGSSRNITERKKAETALLESNELNTSLLHTIPFGIDIVDEYGNILFQNEKMESVFGLKAIGQKCWSLYRDDKRQCHDCPLVKGVSIGETAIYETNGVLGGRTFQISHTGMLFQGKKAMLEIFQDITERKQSEIELIAAKERAEESDRLKSAFLANMSHEVRTPLNSIIGFSELLQEAEFSGQQVEFASLIHKSGNAMLSIISDIMDLSKIEAGQVQVRKTTFSVNKLIAEIESEYAFKAKEKSIELLLDLDDPNVDICIESDETKLRQVLVNFVGNAIKFTNEGYIEIGMRKLADSLHFHVKDTGIGIPAEFHDKIFERFRQVESAFSRKYGGTGLGLPISKSLIELMGGTIWLESEKGKGTTFYFNIPI